MKIEVKAPSIGVTIPTAKVSVGTGTPIAREYVDAPAYDGPYIVTPTQAQQTLQTNGKRMTDNLVVAPIPSNYGLITWDGSTLTVS